MKGWKSHTDAFLLTSLETSMYKVLRISTVSPRLKGGILMSYGSLGLVFAVSFCVEVVSPGQTGYPYLSSLMG